MCILTQFLRDSLPPCVRDLHGGHKANNGEAGRQHEAWKKTKHKKTLDPENNMRGDCPHELLFPFSFFVLLLL